MLALLHAVFAWQAQLGGRGEEAALEGQCRASWRDSSGRSACLSLGSHHSCQGRQAAQRSVWRLW